MKLLAAVLLMAVAGRRPHAGRRTAADAAAGSTRSGRADHGQAGESGRRAARAPSELRLLAGRSSRSVRQPGQPWHRPARRAPRRACALKGIDGILVEEVVVKGIVQTRGAWVAMIAAPSGRTYSVRPGDRLMDGNVRTITAQSVVLLQEVNDPLSLRSSARCANSFVERSSDGVHGPFSTNVRRARPGRRGRGDRRGGWQPGDMGAGSAWFVRSSARSRRGSTARAAPCSSKPASRWRTSRASPIR